MDNKRYIGEWTLVGVFLAIVAIVFQQIATSLTDQGAVGGDALFNAALFPEIVAVTLIGLSALVAVGLIISKRNGASSGLVQEQEKQPEAPSETTSHLRRLQIGIVLLVIVYLLFLKPVGFHLTTAGVISAMIWLLGARPFYYPIFAGIGFMLVISFLFEGLLKVVLPIGFFNLTPPYHLLGL